MTMTNFFVSDSLHLVAPRFDAPFSLDAIAQLNLGGKGTGSILLLDDLIADLESSELRHAWLTARATSPLDPDAIRTVEYL